MDASFAGVLEVENPELHLAYYYLQNGGEPSCLIGTEECIPMEDPPKDLYIITTARKRDTMEWEGDLSPFLFPIPKRCQSILQSDCRGFLE